MVYEQTPQGKDPYLWDIAKKRAAFRKHLVTYLILNTFFWALWFVTGSRNYGNNGTPWPVWPALGWGIGLAFHYFGAYTTDSSNAIEREYTKLQNKQNNAI